MNCKWQVEIDEYARKVLAKHWPDVRRHDDVRTFPPTDAKEWQVDVIAGGFPCQDISNAGLRTGIDGPRSGLWSEMFRIICILRPRFVVVENVAALLNRGMERVLGNLAEGGFDAEWDVLPASAFGLPHDRERLFIVAYPTGERRPRLLRDFKGTRHQAVERRKRPTEALGSYRRLVSRLEQELGEPSVFGTNDGIPNSRHRLSQCGNAVCPPIAEWIGRRILEAAKEPA